MRKQSTDQMRDSKHTTVYVALSGGVDSAAAALSLAQKGYDVRGVYMKTWSPPGRPCPWVTERRDAMRVCAHLTIPFEMWDFTQEYKSRVVNYMVSEYAAGRTPNPDVMCNKEIKFGLFFDRAIAEGADYIATGHYVRTAKKDGTFQLLKGKDPHKDQSYFLWTLTQKHLARTLFPIGECASKQAVREYAAAHGLPVAQKKDSQGVCFVGPIDVQEFLREYITAPTGPIKTVSGREVGTHTGLPFYTIGQRGGVGIGGSGPYYVARKEAATNTLVVAPPADEKELMSEELLSSSLSFVNEEPTQGTEVEVRVRYRQEPVPAVYEGNGTVRFREPVRAVTEGQSAVFYNGEMLVGGGIITARK